MRPSRRSLIAGGLAAAALTGCSRAGGQVLRAADAQPAGYPTVAAVEHMASLLETRSEGRLRMDIFAGGQLGAEKDTLEITIFGGLDFNRINMAPLNTIARETMVPALPFMFRSLQHMRGAVDGAPGETILKALEPHGLIGLCFYDSGARSFYTRDRFIETPADLAGLKIRVQNSDLYVSMVETLGGDATPMVFSEVYQGLIQGVVDGAENNWPSYESTRHFEAAPFYSLTRHVMAPEVLVMSARRWAKLSDEDRALIRQCAKDSVPVMRQIWDARVAASQEKVLAAGVQMIEPDTAPFREAARPVWDRYLTTPELRALAESIAEVEG
ncbi:MAG: TRAP transporter substrate-binding protein [Hyphomonadaceae bacterium]|nr:TRAP transporter substrate-binding protein [Hyphomonadaceae bacterium]